MEKRLRKDAEGARDGSLEAEGVVNSFSVRGGSQTVSAGIVIGTGSGWKCLVLTLRVSGISEQHS